MRGKSSLIALLLIAAFAVMPSGISAVEGDRARIDEDHYGQGDNVGYRPTMPERQYPEHANRPMETVEQPYLTPDTLRVTLQAGESVSEHKTLYLPEDAAPAQGDIVFSFDLTGSMGNAIAEVKVNAAALMESVRVLIPDTYFGVISHQDYPMFYDYCGYAEAYGDPADGDLPYMLNRSLTGDLTDVHGVINGLTLGDGADGPECYSRVLHEATVDDAIGWRAGSTKMVILWGDNVPHDCQYRLCIGGSGSTGGDPGRDWIMGNADDLRILDVVTGMALNDIMLLAMYNGLSSTNLSLWNCFARKTGGEAFEVNPDGTVPGGEDLPSYIASIISAQFTEIDEVTLEVCDPGFEHWLIDVDPPAYYNVVLDEPHYLEYDITLRVPEGTPPGLYCFDICALGDGAIYATQHVCIRVLPGGCIDLEIGCEYNAEPMVPVDLPIYIGDTDGWDITSFAVEICWCSNDFMIPNACGQGEVMAASGWNDYSCERTGDNCITVSSAGDVPLTGSGPLFYIQFTPGQTPAPCECCDVTFGTIEIRTGQDLLPVCPVECEVCMASCSIEGYVYNWYCEENGDVTRTHPIEGADVFLTWCETPMGARVTDASGYYLFDCLPLVYECPYCVEADHPPIPGNIRAYDASLVLQKTVGKLDLEDCPFETDGGPVYPQQIAAEVSCNGLIQSYDASLILQYVVEKIDAWGCPYYWTFLRSEEECSWVCDKQVDFVGVLLGDVSGPLPPPPGDPTDVPVWLGVPSHYEDYVEIPIRMKDGTDICAAEFEIEFDSDAFTVDDVYVLGPTSAFMPAYNVPDPGRLLIGIAGDTCVDGSGRVVMIVFKKKFLSMPVAEPRATLKEALFNEGVPSAVIVDKDWPAEVHRFMSLGPVSPNPSASGTVISFEVPSVTPVKIGIYDVTGQLVRTVYDAQASAGTHRVEWDARDSSGNRVARGVYFVRMEAGDFRASEKLVLLK